MIRIAVVDDDAVLLDLYTAVFHEYGWEILRCDEPTRAVEAIKSQRPDLVVLDIVMGSAYSGWKVLQLLKQDVATREIPILVSTGAPDLAEKESWLHDRGILTVRKPFNIDELCRTVEGLLTRRDQAHR